MYFMYFRLPPSLVEVWRNHDLCWSGFPLNLMKCVRCFTGKNTNKIMLLLRSLRRVYPQEYYHNNDSGEYIRCLTLCHYVNIFGVWHCVTVSITEYIHQNHCCSSNPVDTVRVTICLWSQESRTKVLLRSLGWLEDWGGGGLSVCRFKYLFYSHHQASVVPIGRDPKGCPEFCCDQFVSLPTVLYVS